MKTQSLFASVLSSLLFFGVATASELSPAAPQLFYNGQIITMEGKQPTYIESLVVQNGKIVFIGKKDQALIRFPDSKKTDLAQHTLLPGFIDAHSHFGMVADTMGQVNLSSPPVGDVKNLVDVLNKLVQYQQKHKVPEGQWIFAWGYDESQLEQKQHLTKRDLDQYFPNNPVYLQHTSGHMGVANSKALEIAGINNQSLDPEGGVIVRFPGTTEPTGLVQEVAMYYFAGKAIEESASKKESLFMSAQDYYAENGVTTAQDGMTDPASMTFFQAKAAQRDFKIDLVSLPGASEIENKAVAFGQYQNRLKFQGIKIVADGSPQGRTSFFTQKYLTPVEGQSADYRGFSNLTQEALNQLFVTGYKNKRQLFVHINGDAAIDMLIKAHEFACQTLNQPLNLDRRTVAIHSQFIRPDQLKTFKNYQIMPSFFTNHAFFWGDVHLENLGQERAFFLSPMKAASELGLVFTNHSDATVTPINPLFTVWSAVNRLSRSEKVIGPEQRVSPYIALQAITLHAATQIFDEEIKGSLKVGKLADLVILDQNPLTVAPLKIKDIQILETIKEGQTVFSKRK